MLSIGKITCTVYINGGTAKSLRFYKVLAKYKPGYTVYA